METHLEKICQICGDIGYEETIATCSICRSAHKHAYCMPAVLLEIPEDWACEECTACKDIVPPGCDGKECFQISSDIVHQCYDNVIQGGSMKAYDLHLGKHNFSKRQKAVKTGKVKFLPADEVIKLSSGAMKKGSPAKNDLGCRFGSSSATPQFSHFRTKPRARVIPPGLLMPTGHGRMQISPVTNQQALKTSKEKKAHFKPAEKSSCKKQKIGKEVNAFNATIRTEEVKARVEQATSTTSCTSSSSEHGSNYCIIAEPKNSVVDERDWLNILPKLRQYRPYFPALHATWKGGFKFFDAATPGKFYGGFQAQPPCSVHCKAFEFSKRMPIILQVKLLPQSDVWADLFQNDYPDLDDIALYFFPSANIERSKQTHNSLFELMEVQNSVMIFYINKVELLIFTSKQLPVNSQAIIARSGTENFLWGVFRHGKNDKILCEELHSLVSPFKCEHNDQANMDYSEAIDMEIDMVGGKVLGDVDVAVPKESSRRACREFVKETVDEDALKELNNKNLNAFTDLDSPIQEVLLDSEQAQHKASHLNSKVAQKIDGDLAILGPLQSSLGKLSDAADEADIATGFGEMSRLNFRHRLCDASFREKSRPKDGGGNEPC